MTYANVHQAKSNLSKLLNAAENGDDVYITRRGGSISKFKLVPMPEQPNHKLFGALKGKIVYAKDYELADEQIAKLMSGEEFTD